MKTIIESGHYYEVNGPSHSSIKGWEIGQNIAANIPSAELALFIDDYHSEQTYIEPGDTFLEPSDAINIAETMKAKADHIFSEAALATEAPTIMDILLEDSLVKLKKGVFSTSGVRLGYLRRQRHYSI